MNIIKFILFSLLALLLIAATVIFIFLQTFDSDQYLPRISRQASLALGRSVSIGHLGLGFSVHGITLDVGPLTIADDSDFTSQPFIRLDKVSIRPDLKSLIFKREVFIKEIILQSPRIHFIRNQEGNLNIISIGHSRRAAGDSKDILPLMGTGGDGEEKSVVPFHLHLKSPVKQEGFSFRSPDINSIEINDASISFIDQNKDMPLDIWLKNINANLNDFSLAQTFRITFEASPLLLKSISPQAPDSLMALNIKGDMKVNMGHVQAGSLDAIEASGNILLADGIIRNFNIIKTMLVHSLGNFGNVDGGIGNLLNGPVLDKLGAKDTIIKRLETDFSYHDKTILINNILLKTNLFEFTAQGTVDQGLNTDIQTMLHLNNDVSAALVNELEGLKFLYDDTNRIAIGASLKGVIPHLRYKPNKDFRRKSKQMFLEEGGNILGVLLGGGSTRTQVKDDFSQISGKKTKKSFKNIFKSLLQ